ncbi:hypothetical protein HW115_19295 [Verrucomicrobiaceae bacterium N1E253]|uniref:Uncharacterized protein n=1 Tax=Oceaniferula marina TaxID=2748318 RepID=A0A851GJS7_9BACT|nr:hypothetical protein [Oceaniferula marina]NWK57773.1 hypothetical protein [Oceaniferula marina]
MLIHLITIIAGLILPLITIEQRIELVPIPGEVAAKGPIKGKDDKRDEAGIKPLHIEFGKNVSKEDAERMRKVMLEEFEKALKEAETKKKK